MSFPINKNTPEQRVLAFVRPMHPHCPAEFLFNKAFDYALSLPEVYKLKSQTERLEAAMALVLEATAEARQEIVEQWNAVEQHEEAEVEVASAT